MAENIKRVKVRPYPIELNVQTPAGPRQISIVKLSLKGFIADVKAQLFKAGEEVVIQGVLPADYGSISGAVRVIKTYDQILKGPPRQTLRLAEFHFLKPEQDFLERVHRFLTKINQGKI